MAATVKKTGSKKSKRNVPNGVVQSKAHLIILSSQLVTPLVM